MFRQFRKLEPKEFIVIGCDTASGGGGWRLFRGTIHI